MKRLAYLAAAFLAAGVMAAGPVKGGKPSGKLIEATPGSIQWGDAPAGLPPGGKAAVLEGDPGKAGYFAIRLKAPAGYKIKPHTHPGDERVTVIEGTLRIGMGKTWDESALKEFPAGSYVSLPKGHQHYAFFKDGGVVQIATLGPWGIDYIDPKDDPRKAK